MEVKRMERLRFKDYLKDYLEYNNITNKDFANRIGITPKHLIDILSGNRDLSSQLVENISLVTSISSDYIYRLEMNYKLETSINDYLKDNHLTELEYLKKFDYNYLKKEKYIDFTDSEDRLEMIKDILKFLRVPNPAKVYEIDKNIYFKSKNDKPELLFLWLEKCYRETLKQQVGNYNKENIEDLVEFISCMAMKEQFDEEALICKFNENGIYLVIQDDIPGSKIRGAFRVHRGKPAVYLTFKYKRIADIYFALLHELAHCKTDFNKAQATNLVSFEGAKDESEKKADSQAYAWMVSDTYYDICLKKDYNIELEKNYPKSFILYRMAQDGYIKYSDTKYQHYNVLIKKINEK